MSPRVNLGRREMREMMDVLEKEEHLDRMVDQETQVCMKTPKNYIGYT